MGCWWKLKRLVLLPVRRVWIALSTRFLLKSPKLNGDDGLLKLHDDIQTCGYQDVQVMWEMLTNSNETSLDLLRDNISSTVAVNSSTTRHRLLKGSKQTTKRRRRRRQQRQPFWRIFMWTSTKNSTNHITTTNSSSSSSGSSSGNGFTIPLQHRPSVA